MTKITQEITEEEIIATRTQIDEINALETNACHDQNHKVAYNDPRIAPTII